MCVCFVCELYCFELLTLGKRNTKQDCTDYTRYGVIETIHIHCNWYRLHSDLTITSNPKKQAYDMKQCRNDSKCLTSQAMTKGKK